MKRIVLCTSRVFDTQVHGFVEKLNDRLFEHGCTLLIFTINADLYWEEDNISEETSVFDIIPFAAADAVIIMDEKIKSRTVAEKIIAGSRKQGKPVVIVDGQYEGLPHVKYDYGKGFEQVVRHVLSQDKVRKPHLLAGIPENPFSVEREEIFKRLLPEYGYTFDESMLSYGYFWARPAMEAAEALVASGDIPDAIICANDIMALNVSEVFRNNGYRIPEDVMVSGFDGYDEVFIASPKITTVSCTTQGLAESTADLVLRLIKCPDEKIDESDSVSVIPQLITNESTGCKSVSGFDQAMLERMNDRFYRYQDSVRMLHEVATRMQLSHTTDEMTACLDKLVINDRPITGDMLFILNRNIFDIEHYFFDQPDSETVPSDYNLVYDKTRSSSLVEMYAMDALYRPDDMCRYPLIFNALDYMDRTLGFICYSYRDYDLTSYCRTTDVTNTISMGVGGYVVMTYQRYLSGKVDEMYKRDALTGLYNRTGFDVAFKSLLSAEENHGKPVTFLMSDLDGLKYINDNFGHEEGDNAIARTADALKGASPDDAICVRIGGDELIAVIVGECDAPGIIKKIEELLNKYNETSGKDYCVSSSCGFATTVMSPDMDIKTVFRLADKHMYEVKSEHRLKNVGRTGS